MNADERRPVPEPTLRRLPNYLHFLRMLRARGRDVVSTSHISQDLCCDPTQVRKDLALAGALGKPRVGYHVNELVETIERFLGWDNVSDAFLVGAGSLGTALLGYPRFREYGLNVVAAFDTDPAKIGRTIHDREVLPLERLVDLAQRMHVHIGIITAPAVAAPEIAKLMQEGGIQAIWNFAPVTLQGGDDLVVQNQQMYSSLAVLTDGLKRIRGRV